MGNMSTAHAHRGRNQKEHSGAHQRCAIIFEDIEHNLELAECFLRHFRRVALVNSSHDIAKIGRCGNTLFEFFLLIFKDSRKGNDNVETQKRAQANTTR
jgi:hypothetical protein